MANDSEASAVLEIDPSDLEYARAMAAENGVQMEEIPQENIEPIATALIIFYGTSLAVSTVVYLLDKRKGGQVIDLRPAAHQKFYRTDNLQYGLVAIFTVTGKLTVEVKEPKGMFGTVMESITTLLGKLPSSTAQDLKAGIEQQLGPNVTVRQGSPYDQPPI